MQRDGKSKKPPEAQQSVSEAVAMENGESNDEVF